MDFPPTQIYEDDDLMPTQKIPLDSQESVVRQVGVLTIGANTYPINKGIVKIGRHAACDIVINDQTVSKQHAEIESSTSQVSAWICDLNSSNKTKLNNLVLRSGRCYELKDGSVIEFGRVRAIYKVHRPMDESMVPETPAPLRQKKVKPIIPGTPDSSLNNSSGLEDLSTIPATQGDQNSSVFRRPSLYQQRQSTNSSKTSYKQDSSIDNSTENSRNFTLQQKSAANDNKNELSIYDMETQNPFESCNASDFDIHNLETQKILSDKIKNTRIINQTKIQEIPSNIHDMETQQNETDIHDMETQGKIVDIHDADTQGVTGNIRIVKTPTIKRNVQTLQARNVSDNNDNGDTKDHKVKDTGTNQKKNDISNVETQRVKILQSQSYDRKLQNTRSNDSINVQNERITNNISKNNAPTTYNQNAATLSQNTVQSSQEFLKLSLTTNFDEECSEFERSIDLLGSQNLLIDIEDDVGESVSGEKSKTSTPINSKYEKCERSTDDENIFDVATQKRNEEENSFDAVTQRVDYKRRASMHDDDDDDSETDDEGVFLKYSRDVRKNTNHNKDETGKGISDESSDTDEEGRFAELAIREKRVVSSSFEVSRNETNEVRNESTESRDSEDIFDAPTQRVNINADETNDTSNTPLRTTEIDADITISNNTTLVQDLHRSAGTKDTEYKTETGRQKSRESSKIDITETDDTASTQIIPRAVSPRLIEDNCPADSTTTKTHKEDIIDMDDLPTQVISGSNARSCCSKSPCSCEGTELGSGSGHSTEDIDYEMAATQLITDNENKRTNVSVISSNNKDARILKTSIVSNKPNLDDSIERNLNEMFDDINEETTHEPLKMSTETLQKMLQLSQTMDELSGDEIDVGDNASTEKMSSTKRVTRSKGSSALHQPTDRKSHKSNIKGNISDTDSQKSETQEYFATLTTKRKRNVLPESQEERIPSHEKGKDIKEKESKTTSANATARKSITIDNTKNATSIARNNNESNAQLVQNKDTATKLSEEDNDGKSITSRDNPSTEDKSLKNLQAEKNLDKSEDDILAGLPEVKISGTLSNPPSPTSSVSTERRLSFDETASKRTNSKKAAKKDVGPKSKPSRKAYTRRSIESDEPYRAISNVQSSTFSRNVSNSFAGNLDVDKVSVESNKSSDTHKNISSPRNLRRSTATRKQSNLRQKSSSLIDSAKVDTSRNSTEQLAKSLSVQNHKTTSPVCEENDDSSSVFQVAKEVHVENVTKKMTKRKSVNVSRNVKRTLNADSENEQVDTKKRKVEEANVDVVANTRSRRSATKTATANRRQSANILDFLTRQKSNSPVNAKNAQEVKSINNDQLITAHPVVSVVKLSQNTYKEVSTDGSVDEIQTKHNGRKKVNNNSAESNVETLTGKKKSQNVGSQKSTDSGRSTRLKTNNIIPDVGIESQEVELIMSSSSLTNQTSTVKIDKKSNTQTNAKSTRTRNARKRENTNINIQIESSECSSSSELSEYDNAKFEVPTSKAKRAKASKNANSTMSMPSEEKSKSNQQPRLTRSRRSTADSSTEDSSANNSHDTVTKNNIQNKPEVSKKKGRQPKARIVAENKIQDSTRVEQSDSSGMDTSMEVASMISTPSRTRSSMSSSFLNTSTSSKVKQKILFTGMTGNEYTKILTKLGATQVDDPAKCTVLVTDKVRRTFKFLCALAQAVPIVTVDWLMDSEKAGYFVDLENYILKDPAAEVKFGFKLRRSLEKAKHQKFLEGYTVVLTANVAPPPLPELKNIIVSCGGKPLMRPPTSWPEKAVIVSREEDLAAANKFRSKAPKSVTIQSTEFLLTGILKQELDFVKHTLS